MSNYKKQSTEDLFAYYKDKLNLRKKIERDYKQTQYPVDYSSCASVMDNIEKELLERGYKITGNSLEKIKK